MTLSDTSRLPIAAVRKAYSMIGDGEYPGLGSCRDNNCQAETLAEFSDGSRIT
jgi:hypothetical protein